MPALQIDARFAADRAVHLRQQRRRHLHERDAAQIGRRHEAREVAHHAAAERDDEGFSFQPVRRQLVETFFHDGEPLGFFPGGNGDENRFKARSGKRFQCRLRKMFADVGIRDDGATLAELEPRALRAEPRQQTAPDLDGVTPMTERNLNDAHGQRINSPARVSKIEIQRRLNLRRQSGSFGSVSPTIFRYRSYRFYFFSREEPRMHVHVISPDGEAKFWLEPEIELAVNQGLGSTELNELKKVVEERQNEIREHWRRHFPS